MRPETLDGDWNRLYSEFPQVYDDFARVEDEPRLIDVIGERFPISGADVIDVGAGTGTSTYELAERAASVVGVEPNPHMLAVALAKRPADVEARVEFRQGDASHLPCADESADVVACMTTVFWPPEVVVPRFVAEAMRVLRAGGIVFSLNTAPGWYGGELHDVVPGNPQYENALFRALDAAGFETFDFETVQDYRTPEHAVATFGFIFGGRSIELLRANRQSRIRFRWRVWFRMKTA